MPGSIGWARLDEGGETVAARPGKELLSARQVYFEGWAIDAIADRLAGDEAMRPWLAPRLSPFLRREGNDYIAPNGDTIQLGPLSDGQLYAGRTLVYEDCRRDLNIEIGKPFLADLAPALSLVLASAGWLTHYVAMDHRERFARIYEDLAPQGGPVDFLAFREPRCRAW